MPDGGKYQDAAIRDVLRSGAMALVFSLLVVVCLMASEDARAILDPSPIFRHGNGYGIFLAACALMAGACWAVSLGILATSPAQHDRFAGKNARFDPVTSERRRRPDPDDAGYHTPIWRYWIKRSRRV